MEKNTLRIVNLTFTNNHKISNMQNDKYMSTHDRFSFRFFQTNYTSYLPFSLKNTVGLKKTFLNEKLPYIMSIFFSVATHNGNFFRLKIFCLENVKENSQFFNFAFRFYFLFILFEAFCVTGFVQYYEYYIYVSEIYLLDVHFVHSRTKARICSAFLWVFARSLQCYKTIVVTL